MNSKSEAILGLIAEAARQGESAIILCGIPERLDTVRNAFINVITGVDQFSVAVDGYFVFENGSVIRIMNATWKMCAVEHVPNVVLVDVDHMDVHVRAEARMIAASIKNQHRLIIEID